MPPPPEVSFSELQLHGKATVERLHRTPGQSRRRDAEDLVLTTAARAELEHTAASMTTRMFVALMQRDAGVRELVQEFVLELVATMRAAESLHNPAPVVQVIQSWRHTAEVMADPDLAAVLTADSDLDTWELLRSRADMPPPTSRHHRLKGRLASASHRGVSMEQWQVEVTGGGRIFYLVDPEKRTLWLRAASTGHPKVTDRPFRRRAAPRPVGPG